MVQDLKKYNLKDGLPKTAGASKTAKNGFGTGKPEEQKPEEKPAAGAKSTFVEIPQNLNNLSVKELKQLLEGLGLKHDDCFEKSDMINRVQQYKDNKKAGGASSAQPSA